LTGAYPALFLSEEQGEIEKRTIIMTTQSVDYIEKGDNLENILQYDKPAGT